MRRVACSRRSDSGARAKTKASERAGKNEEAMRREVIVFLRPVQVTGIDGNYRMTCESVMRVLRAHKDSVMAVLEAFVYDPLLNWRLIDCKCCLIVSFCTITESPAD